MPFDTSPGFVSMVQMLSDHARQRPDAVAMRQKEFGIWNEITWADLEEIMLATAAGLMALGMAPRDHVGILSENRSEWVQAQFGIAAASSRIRSNLIS